MLSQQQQHYVSYAPQSLSTASLGISPPLRPSFDVINERFNTRGRPSPSLELVAASKNNLLEDHGQYACSSGRLQVSLESGSKLLTPANTENLPYKERMRGGNTSEKSMGWFLKNKQSSLSSSSCQSDISVVKQECSEKRTRTVENGRDGQLPTKGLTYETLVNYRSSNEQTLKCLPHVKQKVMAFDDTQCSTRSLTGDSFEDCRANLLHSFNAVQSKTGGGDVCFNAVSSIVGKLSDNYYLRKDQSSCGSVCRSVWSDSSVPTPVINILYEGFPESDVLDTAAGVVTDNHFTRQESSGYNPLTERITQELACKTELFSTRKIATSVSSSHICGKVDDRNKQFYEVADNDSVSESCSSELMEEAWLDIGVRKLKETITTIVHLLFPDNWCRRPLTRIRRKIVPQNCRRRLRKTGQLVSQDDALFGICIILGIVMVVIAYRLSEYTQLVRQQLALVQKMSHTQIPQLNMILQLSAMASQPKTAPIIDGGALSSSEMETVADLQPIRFSLLLFFFNALYIFLTFLLSILNVIIFFFWGVVARLVLYAAKAALVLFLIGLGAYFIVKRLKERFSAHDNLWTFATENLIPWSIRKEQIKKATGS